jgi:hypothetical protein
MLSDRVPACVRLFPKGCRDFVSRPASLPDDNDAEKDARFG